jgi:hypothetical protein
MILENQDELKLYSSENVNFENENNNNEKINQFENKIEEKNNNIFKEEIKKYFYIPVQQNFKLSMLISIIEGISDNKNISIILENETEAKNLEKFLKLNGILSFFINQDFKLNENIKGNIFVGSLKDFELKKELNIKYVISINGSESISNLERKFKINSEESTIVIEMLGKFDKEILKMLKGQRLGIFAQRFVFNLNEESRKNRIYKLEEYLSFLKTLPKIENGDFCEFLDKFTAEEVKIIFSNRLNDILNSTIPFLDFKIENTFTAKNQEIEKINVIFNKGLTSGINEQLIKEYILSIPGSTPDSIISSSVIDDKTLLTLKDLNKRDIERRIQYYPLGDIYLEIESIEQIIEKKELEYINESENPYFMDNYNRNSYSDNSRGNFNRNYGNNRYEGNGSRGFDRNNRFNNRDNDSFNKFDRPERRSFNNRTEEGFKGFNNRNFERNDSNNFDRGNSRSYDRGNSNNFERNNSYNKFNNNDGFRPRRDNYSSNRRFDNENSSSRGFSSFRKFDDNKEF